MHQLYGTPYYIAPEILSGSYTEKCDIWSIGVIVYIMLCGRPPFMGNSEDNILKQVRRAEWDFVGPEWSGASAEAKDFIEKLMQKDVNRRLTAVEALAHPWIQKKVKTAYNEGLAKKAV